MTGNNPGNIRRSPSIVWAGEIRPTPYTSGFATFVNTVYGYRAMIKLIQNYIAGGYDTLSEIIYRYAPPSDNNPTEAYINFVADHSFIPRNQKIQLNNLPSVVYWMADFEQTGSPPPFSEAQAALALLNNPQVIPSSATQGSTEASMSPFVFMALASIAFFTIRASN